MTRPSIGRQQRRIAAGIGAAALALLAGCGPGSSERPVTQPQLPSVVVVTVHNEPIEEQVSFVGRVAGVDRVDLRARTDGFLEERRFSEGQAVVPGELLFLIEPDQYQALVEQRRADVAMAEANEENTRAQLARGQELLSDRNISPAEVDKLQAAQAVAEAGVAQVRAALAAAELDLSYTRIEAPIAGRIGLARYSVGNLVGPDSGPLATLVSADPIHVHFPVTHRERQQVRRDSAADGMDLKSLVVLARLADGSLYEHKGRLDVVDVTTDGGTDSLTVRALFPNPEGILMDGQNVGVLVQDETPETAITVPHLALQIDHQGTFVLVVTEEGKAQMRRLELGPDLGAKVVVRSGLGEGERVIVQGLQKVRPGQLVEISAPQPAGSGTP